MYTANETRVVKQLTKELADFCLWHVKYFVYIIYVFRNCYSIVFGHFGFCSGTKLRLRDIAFEMQLSFHVWGSWIRQVPFVCFKTIVLKLMEKQNKNKFGFIHITRNKVYEAQVAYVQNIHGSLTCFTFFTSFLSIMNQNDDLTSPTFWAYAQSHA